jgi:hypothetical protein
VVFGVSMNEVAELSLASLEGIRGKQMVLYRNGEELQPLKGWHNESVLSSDTASECVPLSAGERPFPISSVDSSVIVLGEVDDGFILSGKVSVVSRSKEKRNLLVFGPSIFYIGESNHQELNSLLQQKVPPRLLSHDPAMASRVVRLLMERAAALDQACKMEFGILALDGSLRVSGFEPSRTSLMRIEEECDERGICLVGVTKNTKLRPLRRLQSLLFRSEHPSFLEVTDIVRSITPGVLGSSVLARLSSDGVALRIDIKSKVWELGQTVSNLMASDILCNGYPDTLRAAHILSIFSPGEEESAKGRLVRTEGTFLSQSFNVRRTLLGSMQFGGGRRS